MIKKESKKERKKEICVAYNTK